MAENEIDSPSFSVELTQDVGAGNPELIRDLLSPETATGDSEELQNIQEEEKEKEKKPTVTKPPKKGKQTEVVAEAEKEKAEEEEDKGQDVISTFLEKSSEDEEQESTESAVKEKAEEEEVPEQTSKFTALATDLYTLGVFTPDDENEEDPPITTAEEFLEKFQTEGKKKATEAIQNFIGKFGEDYQNAFEAIFVKGANPKEYFAAYNAVVDYAQMDMTKETNQEIVIRQALTDQGLETEDIDTEVERLKNYGDLETVAAKHHKVLVKKEALKLQHLEQKAEEEQRQKAIIKNTYINNVQGILQEKLKTKEFDGIPINSKLVTELQDFLLVDKWKTPSGETLTDFDRAILELKRPENHANKVKLGLLLKIMEKDPTLSVIQKSGITRKSDAIFAETARQVVKSKGNTGESQKSNPTWRIL